MRQAEHDIFQELWDGTPASTAEEIWRLMNQLTFGAGMNRMTDAAAEVGLNGTQARLLIQLGSRGARSQKDVAAMLHVDPSTITIIVDHLESLKLLERKIDPHDRRGRLLMLTLKGKHSRRRLIDTLFAIPPELTSLPNADQNNLRELLHRLLAPVDAAIEQAKPTK